MEALGPAEAPAEAEQGARKARNSSCSSGSRWLIRRMRSYDARCSSTSCKFNFFIQPTCSIGVSNSCRILKDPAGFFRTFFFFSKQFLDQVS